MEYYNVIGSASKNPYVIIKLFFVTRHRIESCKFLFSFNILFASTDALIFQLQVRSRSFLYIIRLFCFFKIIESKLIERFLTLTSTQIVIFK